MPVLRRNITGHDILALREFIETDAPVSESEIKQCFFPGDPADSSISDKVKLLTDAIGFLEDIDQIVETTDGYRLHDNSKGDIDARISILRGLHSQFGENGAYREALSYIASEDEILAKREGELEDGLSGHAPDIGWNTTNLGYWERTMDCLGVLKKINGADNTLLFVLEYDLWQCLLQEICEQRTMQLDAVLTELDDTYLPVWTAGGEVGMHVQYGLRGLADRSDLELRKASDAGPTYEIGATGVNTLSLTGNF